MIDISKKELEIIEMLRDLKPYESIEIKKDVSGKPDYYIVKREQKIFLTK